ncbi:MAG: RNA-binding protein [SAR86 cluster bacterium]|uniref:Heat shock protein 15 n=1 Tax=SAR86 cluster bacterium TaxID=2030880 RepID=A0A2A4MRZ9_9GAMM|nr:MAG: RNA-binding protein [SAR86 cluster bacterium]
MSKHRSGNSTKAPANTSTGGTLTKVRLDKWLWAARFYKTRALAKQAIEGGKVQCQGAKAKASKEIAEGLVISLRQGFDIKTVLVKALSEHRGGAPQAQLLYEETAQSIELRAQQALVRKHQGGQLITDSKPNKKDRRLIHRFKQEH